MSTHYRDPLRYGDQPRPLPRQTRQDRACARNLAAHACGWLAVAACGVAIVGAAWRPLSYLPQGAFGAAVLLLIAACWLGEGGGNG